MDSGTQSFSSQAKSQHMTDLESTLVDFIESVRLRPEAEVS